METEADGRFETGRISLVSLSAMDSPAELLPDEAFDNLLVVSTRGGLSELETETSRRKVDLAGVYVVPVSGSSLRYSGELQVAERTGPTNLTKTGVVFSNALERMQPEPWVLFDNFNILLMYADEERVYRFMDTMMGNVRAVEGTGVFCTVKDAIDDQTFEKFSQLADREVDLR